VSSHTPERLRIARELHDGIAQDLVGLGYQLDLIMADSQLSELSRNQVRASRLHVDSLIIKVRNEILELRRDSEVPLHTLLRERAQEICSGIEISFELEEVAADAVARSELLAVASEILRNIVAHAGATLILIKLYSVNNLTCLEISDNGNGGAVMKESRWGLQGITERIHALNGSFTLEERDGTHISISV
jgi:signal transduction histidine kinase